MPRPARLRDPTLVPSAATALPAETVIDLDVERLTQHRRVLTLSLAFACLLALALLVAAWPLQHPQRVALWLVLVVSAMAARLALARTAAAAARALRRQRAGMLAHGLAWSLLAWAIPAGSAPGIDGAVAAALLLVTAGALVATAFDLPAALLFATPTFIALALHLVGMSQPGTAPAMGLIPPLLMGAVLAYALRGQRLLREAVAERQASAQAREELAEQGHRMALLLAGTPVGYWFIDTQGISTQVNPAMCALLGRRAEDVIGRDVRAFFSGDSLQRLRDELARREQGEAGVYEIELERPDGSRVYCINNATALQNRRGERIGSVGLWTDITERRRSELAQRTYAFLVNSMHDMVSVIDERERYWLVNDAWAERVGVARERIIGRTIDEVGTSISERRRTAFLDCLRTGETQVVRDPAGSATFGGLSVESTYYRYLDPLATLRSVIVVTRDMSAEDLQRAMLEESEHTLMRMLDATGDAIFASDARTPDQPVRYCNQRMLGLWNIPPEHQATVTPAEIMACAGRMFAEPEREAGIVAQVIASNQPHESKVTLNDGRVLLRRCNPVSLGDRILRVWTFRDITVEARASAVMQQARDEADRANRAKSEFLGTVSHELRTPLNAILGFAEMLGGDSALPEPAREAARHIGSAGGHLLTLVDDMIDLVRIESGRLSLVPGPVALADLLSECTALVQPMARERQVRLMAGLEDARGMAVRADRVRLRQVLLNLLSNAIKYNRAGGEVRLICQHRDARVRVSVLDTGPGIEGELHARVFTPFDRLGADRGPVEGSGIGLVICRHLMEAMGGRIGFDSEPRRGSVFWIELPPANA